MTLTRPWWRLNRRLRIVPSIEKTRKLLSFSIVLVTLRENSSTNWVTRSPRKKVGDEEKRSIALKLKIYEGTPTRVAKLTAEENLIELGLPGSKKREKLGQVLSEMKFELISQPTLVSKAGRVAEFISGGEIPYQKLERNGKKTVEMKLFGLVAKLTPSWRHGELFVGIDFESSDIESLKWLENQLPDGTKFKQPSFSATSINTTIRMQPNEASLVV